MENKHNFDDLSKQLVEKVSAGKDVSPLTAEINSMSPQERLQFVQNLNKTVSDDSLKRAVEDTFSDRLLLDVRLANNGTVADIDLLRRAKSNEPNNKLTRIDLFDSGNAAGKDADEKQRLDAIANPYQELFFLSLRGRSPRGPIENNEVYKDLASRMTRDIADPVEAKKIEANFLNNLKNVWELGETYTSGKHSRVLFDEGAYEGSREKVVPVDLQRDLDNLYRLNRNQRGEELQWSF